MENEINDDTEDFLQHFGVKGMRWGHRSADNGGDAAASSNKAGPEGNKGSKSSSDSGGSAKPKKLTMKEVRQEKTEFYEAKANKLFETAAKDPEVLISLKSGYDAYPTVVTGKEFVNHMVRGGFMDIKSTDIWAAKNADGAYEAQAPDRFMRSDKRAKLEAKAAARAAKQ